MESKKTLKLNHIINGDLHNYVKTIPNEFVNEIILDPPYFKVVNEKWDKQWKSLDDYLAWMKNIINELYRVSKYSCSCWIFGFPYQLSYIIPLMEEVGFVYKQTVTIHKGLRSVAGRTSSKLKMFPTASEYALFFYKDSRKIIKNFLQEKQKEHKVSSKAINIFLGKASNGGGTWSSIAGKRQTNTQYPTKKDWDKLQELFGEFKIKYEDYVYKFNQQNGLTDVWNDINFYDKTYKKVHPTQKPYKLIERLVKCSSNENDIILDLFMGSGMTAKVCKDLNRNYIGCEINEKYFNNLLQKNDQEESNEDEEVEEITEGYTNKITINNVIDNINDIDTCNFIMMRGENRGNKCGRKKCKSKTHNKI